MPDGNELTTMAARNPSMTPRKLPVRVVRLSCQLLAMAPRTARTATRVNHTTTLALE